MTKVTEKLSGVVTSTVEYGYDALNRLVRRIEDADGPGSAAPANQFFVYDGNQVVLQFDGDSTDDLSHRYLWGIGVDQLLADEQISALPAAGTVKWTFGDHLGTIRDIAEYDSGTGVTSVVNHREYDSFGTLLSESNAAHDVIFGYTGRYFDEATGLQNNLNRWYDPRIGQWTSEDPIGFEAGDANARRYVSNLPTQLIDPTGLIKRVTIYIAKNSNLPSNFNVAKVQSLLNKLTAPAGIHVSLIVTSFGPENYDLGFVWSKQSWVSQQPLSAIALPSSPGAMILGPNLAWCAATSQRIGYKHYVEFVMGAAPASTNGFISGISEAALRQAEATVNHPTDWDITYANVIAHEALYLGLVRNSRQDYGRMWNHAFYSDDQFDRQTNDLDCAHPSTQHLMEIDQEQIELLANSLEDAP